MKNDNTGKTHLANQRFEGIYIKLAYKIYITKKFKVSGRDSVLNLYQISKPNIFNYFSCKLGLDSMKKFSYQLICMKWPQTIPGQKFFEDNFFKFFTNFDR